MRYLILAAGMGRRLGGAQAGVPKCLIEIGGEPLLGRLLRQIRRHDPAAEVVVVLGYRAETIAPVVIRIGRSRKVAASTTASRAVWPSSRSRLANWTIRMPCLLISPIKVTSPIWL